jgi:hypothetical protein
MDQCQATTEGCRFTVAEHELLDPGDDEDAGLHTTGIVPVHPASERIRPQRLREWVFQRCRSRGIARLAAGAEILTMVSGEGAPIPLTELEGHEPEGVELELHEGGQPHYWWLLAAQ